MLINVAPHAGAWIEIINRCNITFTVFVAPHAGAWIEIDRPEAVIISLMSLPTRERGLK